MSASPTTTQTVFAMCVTAEVRARAAAQNLGQGGIAAMIKRSPNYVSERLTDKKPFSVDDLSRLADGFADGNVSAFVEACERQRAVVEAMRRAGSPKRTSFGRRGERVLKIRPSKDGK